MGNRTSGLVAAVAAALVLSMSAAVPTRAADGQLTFQLTLRGDVRGTDAFALFTDGPELTIGPERGFFCGPPIDGFIYNVETPICAPGEYAITLTLPIGWSVAYTFARYPLFAGTPTEQHQNIYADVVTVTGVPQARYLVVNDSAQQPQLPDSAIAPANAIASPVVGTGALLVGVGLVVFLARRRRNRSRSEAQPVSCR